MSKKNGRKLPSPSSVYAELASCRKVIDVCWGMSAASVRNALQLVDQKLAKVLAELRRDDV